MNKFAMIPGSQGKAVSVNAAWVVAMTTKDKVKLDALRAFLIKSR